MLGHLAKADPACAERVKKSITALDMECLGLVMRRIGRPPTTTSSRIP